MKWFALAFALTATTACTGNAATTHPPVPPPLESERTPLTSTFAHGSVYAPHTFCSLVTTADFAGLYEVDKIETALESAPAIGPEQHPFTYIRFTQLEGWTANAPSNHEFRVSGGITRDGNFASSPVEVTIGGQYVILPEHGSLTTNRLFHIEPGGRVVGTAHLRTGPVRTVADVKTYIESSADGVCPEPIPIDSHVAPIGGRATPHPDELQGEVAPSVREL